MQSLNNISTSHALDQDFSASSANSASSLGADFAAMLFELSSDNKQGLSGIFSAISKIHASNQAIGAKLPLSSAKASSAAVKNNTAKVTAKIDEKSSSFEKSSKNSDEERILDSKDDRDDEKSEHKETSSTYDADTYQWMSAMLAPAVDPNNSSFDEENLSTLAPTAKELADDLSFLGKASSKSATNASFTQQLQNLDKNATLFLDSAKGLIENGGSFENAVASEDASLAYMMAQSGVKELKVSEGSSLSLLEQNAEELGLIDDSLQELQKIDNGANDDLTKQGEQNQSLNNALSQLRQSLTGNNENNLNTVDFMISTSNLSSDLENRDSTNTQSLGVSVDELTGAATPLSDARRIAREDRASQLRRDMLTLSSDVRKNAEEISKAVMTMASRNMKKFTFDLNPNGLGRMEISIDADENDNAVNVTIAAQELATRRLVAQSLDALKLALFDHGVEAKTSMSDFSGEGQFDERQQEPQEQAHTGILFAENSINDEDVEQLSADESISDDGALNLFA